MKYFKILEFALQSGNVIKAAIFSQYKVIITNAIIVPVCLAAIALIVLEI
jgi:hypothetical protein